MIPKLFHSVWVGDPIPPVLNDYIATWRRVHPYWGHRIWTEDELSGWLVNQDLFDDAEKHTEHVGQFRSDVARYEILYRFGGVYVDCDFEARKPIDDLVDNVGCFAAWETDDVWINNAIVGATPGHPLFAELIAALPSSIARNRGKRPNVMTGPQFLTPHARRHNITVFASSRFYPYRFDELDRASEEFPDAYAVHHWANQRKKWGYALPAAACPTS